MDYKLRNGDVIEIMTQTNAAPSRDWVDMVKTLRARNKIRRYFRSQDREDSIQHGEQLIADMLRDEDLSPKEFMARDRIEKLLEHFNYHTADELYAAVGFGDLSAQAVVNRLTVDLRREEENQKQKELEEKILNSGQQAVQEEQPKKNSNTTMKVKHKNGVMIQGVSDLMLHLAKCCNPVPGDKIIGYVTKGRGVTIHRTDCRNITKEAEEQGRLIDVEWENVEENSVQSFNANIEVFGYNRSNLLSDVINKLNSLTKNINNISGKVNEDNVAHMYVTVAVRNADQLDEILSKLRDIPDVYETKRSDN